MGTIAEFIEYFEGDEENVAAAWVGPQYAWFEINGERYPYVSYVIGAEHPYGPKDALNELKAVLKYEIRKARGAARQEKNFPDSNDPRVNIVWRLRDKVKVNREPDGKWYARTRLVLVPAEGKRS